MPFLDQGGRVSLRSKEQGAESREQGELVALPRSRRARQPEEQGAGSREQGAGSKESWLPFLAPCSLLPAPCSLLPELLAL